MYDKEVITAKEYKMIFRIALTLHADEPIMSWEEIEGESIEEVVERYCASLKDIDNMFPPWLFINHKGKHTIHVFRVSEVS